MAECIDNGVFLFLIFHFFFPFFSFLSPIFLYYHIFFLFLFHINSSEYFMS